MPIKSARFPTPGEEKAKLEADKAIKPMPILTTASGPPPPLPDFTYYSAEPIVGMVVFQDRLFIATQQGVYVRGPDGVFKRLKFEMIEEERQEQTWQQG